MNVQSQIHSSLCKVKFSYCISYKTDSSILLFKAQDKRAKYIEANLLILNHSTNLGTVKREVFYLLITLLVCYQLVNRLLIAHVKFTMAILVNSQKGSCLSVLPKGGICRGSRIKTLCFELQQQMLTLDFSLPLVCFFPFFKNLLCVYDFIHCHFVNNDSLCQIHQSHYGSLQNLKVRSH